MLFAHSGKRALALVLLLTLTAACSQAAGLFHPRRTLATLLADPPAASESVEIDAYFSGAAVSSPGNARPDPDAESGAIDPYCILSDQPFLPELSLLGGTIPNPLPADAAYCIAAPGAVALAELPYHARLRGRLSEPIAAAEGGAPVRSFTIEQVVRVYARQPTTPTAAAPSTWRRYQDSEAGYSLPQPPGWRVERASDGVLTLHARQWPDHPISICVYPGETHHDPYDPEATPPLLQNVPWTPFVQSAALGPDRPPAGLAGYRIDSESASGGHTAILFSAHGYTYQLSVSYPLGLAAAQPLLTAYTDVVAGFRLEVPPEPSPTPPVRQELGPGPFLEEKDVLEVACGLLQGQIEVADAHLVSEAEARRLARRCAAFTGHVDGVWVLNLQTPASSTHALRLLLEATSGRELCREEINPAAVPTPTPVWPTTEFGASRPPEADRGERWVEVNLAEQTVTAWEGNTPVRRMYASTGTAEHPTVTGRFRIYWKLTITTMTGPGYSIPGVPHVMYFYEGYALHGAYWHFNFGTPISHGCVNLTLGDAAWLFDWTRPELPADAGSVQATVCNPGTLVVVH